MSRIDRRCEIRGRFVHVFCFDSSCLLLHGGHHSNAKALIFNLFTIFATIKYHVREKVPIHVFYFSVENE